MTNKTLQIAANLLKNGTKEKSVKKLLNIDNILLSKAKKIMKEKEYVQRHTGGEFQDEGL